MKNSTPLHLCSWDIEDGSLPPQWPLYSILAPADENDDSNTQTSLVGVAAITGESDNVANEVENDENPMLDKLDNTERNTEPNEGPLF